MTPIITLQVRPTGGGTASNGVKTLSVSAAVEPRGAFLFKLSQTNPAWNRLGYCGRNSWRMYLGGPYDPSINPLRSGYDPMFSKRGAQ